MTGGVAGTEQRRRRESLGAWPRGVQAALAEEPRERILRGPDDVGAWGRHITLLARATYSLCRVPLIRERDKAGLALAPIGRDVEDGLPLALRT
jgi:hypothetical protein